MRPCDSAENNCSNLFFRLHPHSPRKEWITSPQLLPTFDHQSTLKRHLRRHSIRQHRNKCLACSLLTRPCVLLLQILLQTCHIQPKNGKRRNLLPNSELKRLPKYRILQPRLPMPTILLTQLLRFITELIQISRHRSVSTSLWI